MRLIAQQIPQFLQDPSACRVVLLYGNDIGIMRNRADTLTRAIVGSLVNPFRITELSRNEFDNLTLEAASCSLTGGRRVIRMRNVTDAVLPHVRSILSSDAKALVIMEGPDLPARSRLRAFLDCTADGVAIGCYPEDSRAREETIRHILKIDNVSIDRNTLKWINNQLGGDQLSTHGEIEKLMLYAGRSGQVEFDTAVQCITGMSGSPLEDALFALTSGDVAVVDRALDESITEGATSVGILRACLIHLQRLYRAQRLVEAGSTSADATKATHPFLNYRRTPDLMRAIARLPPTILMSGMLRLSQAERECKRNGSSEHTLASYVVLIATLYMYKRLMALQSEQDSLVVTE